MNGMKILITLLIVSTGFNLYGQNSVHPGQDRKKQSLTQQKLSTITPVPSKLKKFMPSRHNQKLRGSEIGGLRLGNDR